MGEGTHVQDGFTVRDLALELCLGVAEVAVSNGAMSRGRRPLRRRDLEVRQVVEGRRGGGSLAGVCW